jgi:uncharacterized membrane protein YozB (DUF420 family)
MKTLMTTAAAAAIAVAAAAPVAAQDATADPFVSTQGNLNTTTTALIGAGLVIGIIAIAGIDSSDDT